VENIEGKLTRNCFSFTRGRKATVLCMRGSGGGKSECSCIERRRVSFGKWLAQQWPLAAL